MTLCNLNMSSLSQPIMVRPGVFTGKTNIQNILSQPMMVKPGVLAGQTRQAFSELRFNTQETSQSIIKPNEIQDLSMQSVGVVLDLEEEDEGQTLDLVKMYEQVGDVDIGDEDNLLLVSSYVKHIYDYLLFEVEPRHPLKQNFIHPDSAVLPRMRMILFDWLVQVHGRYSLLPETLYMTFNIVDRYLQAKPIVKKNLQLLGVATMFLAAKYEEMYAPEITDFVYITDNTYTTAEIREMERDILTVMDFQLNTTYPIMFLRRYSKVAKGSNKIHHIAKYLAELSQINYETAYYPASAIAAASFCTAIELLGDGTDIPNSWNDLLTVYSGYCYSDLVPIMHKLVPFAAQQVQPSRYRAVFKKYTSVVHGAQSSNFPDFSDAAVLAKYFTL